VLADRHLARGLAFGAVGPPSAKWCFNKPRHNTGRSEERWSAIALPTLACGEWRGASPYTPVFGQHRHQCRGSRSQIPLKLRGVIGPPAGSGPKRAVLAFQRSIGQLDSEPAMGLGGNRRGGYPRPCAALALTRRRHQCEGDASAGDAAIPTACGAGAPEPVDGRASTCPQREAHQGALRVERAFARRLCINAAARPAIPTGRGDPISHQAGSFERLAPMVVQVSVRRLTAGASQPGCWPWPLKGVFLSNGSLVDIQPP